MVSKIVGWGHCLPETVVANTDLPKELDTTDQWIIDRTGIKQRYIASSTETTRTLATQAALKALHQADYSVQDIDAIILATTTADKTFPATAVEVQRDLQMHHGFAFDIQAVCSGFIYALSMANSLICAEQARTVLVIGSETMSRLVDWTDRRTCILFGDGAGALILRQDSNPKQGILSTKLYSDGQFNNLLYTNGGPSFNQLTGTLEINGKEVFRHAVQKMTSAMQNILQAHQLTLADVDWIVPHQANQRILEAIAERMQAPLEKMISTVDIHANTSAASIPLALSAAAEKGLLKKGQLILCTALGGGFTWGACLMYW